MPIDPELIIVTPVNEIPTVPLSELQSGQMFGYTGDGDLKKVSTNELLGFIKSGTTGFAKEDNAPTPYDPGTYPDGLVESYKVVEPISTSSDWYALASAPEQAKFPITQDDLDANSITFDVTDGVVAVFSTPKQNGTDGTDGKDAYQSYLDTTADSPPMTEAEWAVNKANYDKYLFNITKEPKARILTGYTAGIAGVNDYYGEYDNWFNGLERKLYQVKLGSLEAGVTGIGIFTISGTTATLFSSKNLTTVAGENTYSASEISDTPFVVGTKYYIFFKKVTGITAQYKSDNTGKGRVIAGATPTTLSTTNFSISYYLLFRNSVLLDDTVAFDFANEVASRDVINIPVGVWSVNEKVTFRSGQKITGIKGKSILEFDTTVLTDCSEISGIEDVTLRDFTIRGKDANTVMSGNVVGSGVIADITNAIALTNIGTHNGIFINASKGVTIDNLEVSNFNGVGIRFENYGALYQKTSKFSNIYIHDCYAGYSFQNQGEYNTIIGCHANRNQFGIIVGSGNNTFSGCNITGNRVNALFLAGVNNAHGSINGGTWNHASLAGFIFNDIGSGQVINGINNFYADIYVKNSKGIVFNGCQIASSAVYADGNFAGGGTWMIANSMVQSLTLNLNYNGNTSNLKLKNNWKMDGTDSSGYNN